MSTHKLEVLENGTLNPVKQYWINGQLRRLPPLHSRVARRVDVRHDPRDFLCCLLGSCGFSTECIAFQTGLSTNQVAYRLKKGWVSRKAYRDGKSVIALQVLHVCPQKIIPLMSRELKALELHPPIP
jgi:hypothetical protein